MTQPAVRPEPPDPEVCVKTTDIAPDELRLARSRIARRLYVGAGFVALGLGLIGLLLPVFPTSPFLLLAAACFSRGSERFYRWLLSNRYCGKQIRSWRNNEGISIRTKVVIITMLAVTISVSAIFVVPYIPVKIIMVLIAIAVSVYIWRQPTKCRAGAQQG
jgi:uncharacterized protein